jgi:curli biogenesis system outer membrane secretion channel CsgG
VGTVGCRRALLLRLLLLPGAVAAPLDGCSIWQSDSGSSNRPVSPLTTTARQETVLVGDFRNPPFSPMRWRSIGTGMSEAFANELRKRGELDVRVNAGLVRRIETLVEKPEEIRRTLLDEIRQDDRRVRYVVTGAVTDFGHTSDLPEEVRRSVAGRNPEAMVAIRLKVIDLRLGRVVLSEQVHGLARAPEDMTSDAYRSMTFGTYVFWSSPLGVATRQAIDQGIGVLEDLRPAPADSAVVLKQVGYRKLRVEKVTDLTVPGDHLFFVCLTDETTGVVTPLVDPHTGRPLRAKIDSSTGRTVTAWLLGQKPLGVDLQGALLCSRIPEQDGPLAVEPTERASPEP